MVTELYHAGFGAFADSTLLFGAYPFAKFGSPGAEYYGLYAVVQNWGGDFISLYDTYSKEALASNWAEFWIGSEDNEDQRLYFDRAGDKWEPRTVLALE